MVYCPGHTCLQTSWAKGGSTVRWGAASTQDTVGKGLYSWKEVLASPTTHVWSGTSSSRQTDDTAMCCLSSCSTKCLPCTGPHQIFTLHPVLPRDRIWDLSCWFSPCCWAAMFGMHSLPGCATCQTSLRWVHRMPEAKWVLLGQMVLNDGALRTRRGCIDRCACVWHLLQSVRWNTSESNRLERAIKWTAGAKLLFNRNLLGAG